ncbi:MAG: TfoX/Sxy family DNA transformation protein, partial [Planctomyces sp.]
MKPDNPLETLRNLGPQSCRWLREVGIHTISQLRQIGPVGA